MSKQVVFFSRCKPQMVDAIEIVLAERRIFIGYPMGRAGVEYNPRSLRSCTVDLKCDDDEWAAAHARSDKNRQYNRNRNLVREVGVGSIALVPRPDRGVIYCGRIVSGFELEDSPEWYDRYMAIRGDEDGSENWHAADIGQCWRVDEFKPLPVPRVPAWIRRSLFGRSTYGVIRADAVSGNPVEIFERLLIDDSFCPREWSLDVETIKRRLLEDFTPSAFEHLAVSLLQLEHPHEVWLQVGGSGDGGVDGVGIDENGRVSGLLQCKWQYWGEEPFAEDSVWKKSGKPLKKYLAVLRHGGNAGPADCEFLDIGRIAELVRKHHARLPQAVSMRVGDSLNSGYGECGQKGC